MDEDIVEQERLTGAITKILARHDPAAIGPGKYSDETEYQPEAREIANWIRKADNPARANLLLLDEGIRMILEKRLGVDCHRTDAIAREVQKLL